MKVPCHLSPWHTKGIAFAKEAHPQSLPKEFALQRWKLLPTSEREFVTLAARRVYRTA